MPCEKMLVLLTTLFSFCLFHSKATCEQPSTSPQGVERVSSSEVRKNASDSQTTAGEGTQEKRSAEKDQGNGTDSGQTPPNDGDGRNSFRGDVSFLDLAWDDDKDTARKKVTKKYEINLGPRTEQNFTIPDVVVEDPRLKSTSIGQHDNDLCGDLGEVWENDPQKYAMLRVEMLHFIDNENPLIGGGKILWNKKTKKMLYYTLYPVATQENLDKIVETYTGRYGKPDSYVTNSDRDYDGTMVIREKALVWANNDNAIYLKINYDGGTLELDFVNYSNILAALKAIHETVQAEKREQSKKTEGLL